jgi:tRNA(adenine34) deaminase
MEAVIERAELCGGDGEVPVAAAIVLDDEIIALSTNEVECSGVPWRHAEFISISEALEKLQVRYLEGASIYVTMEPCSFCAAVIEKVRIKNIFFGAYDVKCGAIFHTIRLFDHSLIKPKIIGGIQEERCSEILKRFFDGVRRKKDVIQNQVK